jgi:pimeloyl-ACP methyl ester carboxylesterase
MAPAMTAGATATPARPWDLGASITHRDDAKPAPERIDLLEEHLAGIIPPKSRQAVRDHYAGAHLHTLKAGSHYPHILNPQAYNAVVTSRIFD